MSDFVGVGGKQTVEEKNNSTVTSVSRYIDHTVLKQSCQEKDIQQVCDEAKEYQFAAVCVPPYWVKSAKKFLEGTDVKVVTVIGFPFGYSVISSKVEETKRAIEDGADEVDVVANISAIKQGQYDYLRDEISAILTVVRAKEGLICKVIIESGILTNEEIIECCKVYDAASIDYLKTSTGYAEKGASVEAVRLFRQNLSPSIQIKASGGIRTLSDAKAMIEAGATRLGCSASVNIVKEERFEVVEKKRKFDDMKETSAPTGGY